MIFAQFYCESAIGHEIVEACGDRSVIILDGRYSNAANNDISMRECLKRGYIAYSIHRGESLCRSTRISGPWYPQANTCTDNSSMSATFGA